MPPILVLYASHYGQTRAIAERIGDRLKKLGHAVDLVDARSTKLPSPDDYDLIVFGSRVEVGRHAPEIQDYMHTHRDDLRDVPTAFFSVSMAAARASAGADPDGYMDALFTKLDWKPTRAVAFAGGLPYRKYGWFLRFMMKRISRSGGHTTDTSKNHDFTDWTGVDAFADEVAAMLPDWQQARRM